MLNSHRTYILYYIYYPWISQPLLSLSTFWAGTSLAVMNVPRQSCTTLQRGATSAHVDVKFCRKLEKKTLFQSQVVTRKAFPGRIGRQRLLRLYTGRRDSASRVDPRYKKLRRLGDVGILLFFVWSVDTVMCLPAISGQEEGTTRASFLK